MQTVFLDRLWDFESSSVNVISSVTLLLHRWNWSLLTHAGHDLIPINGTQKCRRVDALDNRKSGERSGREAMLCSWISYYCRALTKSRT